MASPWVPISEYNQPFELSGKAVLGETAPHELWVPVEGEGRSETPRVGTDHEPGP